MGQRENLNNTFIRRLSQNEEIFQTDQNDCEQALGISEEAKNMMLSYLVGRSHEYYDSLYDKLIVKDYVLREGWVQKKTSLGFSKVYLVLTLTKLNEYRDEQRKNKISCICFEFFKCRFSGTKFELQFEDSKNCLIYKTSNKIRELSWLKSLQNVITSISDQVQLDLIKNEIPRYFGRNIITELDFLEMTDTGDILLFQTDNIGAKIQRVIAGSEIDHIAMVVRLDNIVSIFDSNGDSGVTLMEWHQFIEINDLYSRVILRKLRNVNKEFIHKNLIQFIKRVSGLKYQVTATKILKRWWGNKNMNETNINDQEGFFCSELIAKFFKKCKLLETEKESCSFWPVDFCEEKSIQLSGGAYLDREFTVVLNKHRQCYQ